MNDPIRRDLDGEKLLRSMAAREKRLALQNAVLLLGAVLFLIVMLTDMVREGGTAYFIMLCTSPVWFLLIYYPALHLRQHLSNLETGENAELFTRAGSPETLAATVSDPANEQVLPSKKVILTRDYLMYRGDYYSYLPLSDIKSITVKHAGYCRSHHVQLIVHSAAKGVVNFNFEDDPLLSSGSALAKQTVAIVREHMRIYAPHCTVHSIYQ